MWSPTFFVFDPAKNAIDMALVKLGVNPDVAKLLENDENITGAPLAWETCN